MEEISNKIPVGILGATGMVGQRFITLLHSHPWFQVVALAASEQSAGKTYAQAVTGRWLMPTPLPKNIGNIPVFSVGKDAETVAKKVKLVFSAFEADKELIKKIEEHYASLGVAVVSNNSAHRWSKDVPMLMPEINPSHLKMIDIQRKNRGWENGLIITKPNCSLQSYVPLLKAWEQFQPIKMVVSTYQAISGAGKTLATWPEMIDNVIPFIGGEEEKSEKEPGKILAQIKKGNFVLAGYPKISANCIRVPVSDGHLAAINIQFAKKVEKRELIKALRNFKNPLANLKLPSAPNPFITYFDEENRPQTKLDRDLEHGMGISVGRLRHDSVLSWKCVALSHNTLRGASGGSVLNAELLYKLGYIK